MSASDSFGRQLLLALGRFTSVSGPERVAGGRWQQFMGALTRRTFAFSGPGLTEALARSVLARMFGAVRVAELERLHVQVLEQEQRVAERLRRPGRPLDFAELRALHERSWQTAELAKASLDGARSTEQTIGEAIRTTHRAIETEQAGGGRGVSAMRQTLEALHVDRDVVRTYRDRYRQDLSRLIVETGRLRDFIGANCGPEGRRWHQTLLARTRAHQGERQ
ncbi:hypothetical protein SAMN06264365_104392 [Actinoplanes regularis]|uniref:Uncharacterized protein n=2 Tax=Actinoplanes regularis TaxID=52697 RepID=A0A238YA97_9ACTN|nr:hypothetical protein Are01nite_25370 [Actinoplanes regularis]SNR67950.1 hypothetical protein SAMN06264365_104392 [Actinoplanes regularis]